MRRVAEALARERRPLDENLTESAEQHGDGDRHDPGSPSDGMTGTSRNAHTIVATLNIAGDSAGTK